MSMPALPRFLLYGLLCWCFASGTLADERDAEIARLKERVLLLEQENRQLRTQLGDAAATKELTLEVTPNQWGGAGMADVRAVLLSAATPLWNSAGSPPLTPITVIYAKTGPMVHYRRGPQGNYVVELNVQGQYWSQFAFQFSHEVAHILANYRGAANKQAWFEESICETASLYALRRMAETWQTKPPYANWKPYSQSLAKYADDRLASAEQVSADQFVAWYLGKRDDLEGSAVNRKWNLVVATHLLPIFEKHPDSWQAVRSLNQGDPAENESLRGYLQAWHTRLPESQRPVAEDIAALFDIELGQK